MPSSKPVIGKNDLLSQRPDIASEWNYDKNANLKPTMVRLGSNKKVWWKCYLGHEYQATICDRVLGGTGCPYCAGKQVLTGFNDLATTFPRLASEWNYDKNGNLLPTKVTKGINKQVWWKCEKYGHEWQASINARTNSKCGCPYCSNQKVLKGFNDLASKYPDLVKEWDFDKNASLTPYEVTCLTHKKVWWRCEKGHSYQAQVVNRIYEKTGCPYCSGRLPLVGKTDLASRYPKIAEEWDYFLNQPLTPKDVTAYSSKMVAWICPKGHSYETRVCYRTKQKSGCPFCSNNQVMQYYNDFATFYPDLVKEWDYEKNGSLKPYEVSCHSTKKIWWKCSKGHSWYVDIDHRTRGHNCPYCNRSKTESLCELLLSKQGVLFDSEYMFKNNEKVKNKKYDFYLKELQLIIEPDGEQHFEKGNYHNRHRPFKEQVDTDNLKNIFAFTHNIPILRIPYIYDPLKNKTDIERLLKDFIKTKRIPQEIIAFYEQYEFSNYADLARKWNERL